MTDLSFFLFDYVVNNELSLLFPTSNNPGNFV